MVNIYIYLRETAEERLHVVASERVPDEQHLLVPHVLQEHSGVEPGEAAIAGLPSPVEVVCVRPPVLDTVLIAMDEAAGICGVRRRRLVSNPRPFRQVARAR